MLNSHTPQAAGKRTMNFENIHNYYEKLVLDHMHEHLIDRQGITDQNLLEDVACVALNRLPTRYVRHDVDTAFFTRWPLRWRRRWNMCARTVSSAAENSHAPDGASTPRTA